MRRDLEIKTCILIDGSPSINTLEHSHITEDTRKAKQQEVSLAIQRGDAEDIDIVQRKEELQARDDITDGEFGYALQKLEEQKKSLDMSQALLKELLAKVQQPAISQMAAKMKEQAVTVTFGNNNHNTGLQLGVSNGDISYVNYGVPR